MANKRIDDASRTALTTLESGYKVLVDKNTVGAGTKTVDLDKLVWSDNLVVLTQTAYEGLTPDTDKFYFTYTE